MFKLGGDTIDAQGTGITSGLDVPRQGYADPDDRVKTISERFSEIDVGVSPALKKRAFWSGIGEGFGSNPRTLGEALRGTVAARDKILGPAEAAAGERRFKLDVAGVEMPYERDTLTILQDMGDENRKEDGTIDTSNPSYQSEIDTITQGFN